MRSELILLSACVLSGAVQAAAPGPLAKRGGYLVGIMGCNDCHTPLKMGPKGPEPDLSLLLSGHPSAMKLPPPPDLGQGPWMWAGAATMTAFAGPWGTSFAANLTPDQETGLGAWDLKTFIKAMRTGKHLGKGRGILPPMPWQGVGHATDADLKAVWAYLNSLKPIRNAVPDPVAPVHP